MKKSRLYTLVAIAAVCIIAIVTTILLIAFGKTDSEDKSGVTRAEWITLLGQEFGLATYEQSEPYYSDVPSNHTAFPYAQSCYEWEILRDKTVFHPEETASRAFVAETAMLAVTLERDPSIAEKDAEELLQLACDEGIISSQSTTSGVSESECAEIIQKLKEYYFEYIPEEYTNITLKQDVMDYRSADITWKDEDTLVVPEDVGATLSEGAIFLAPGYPSGIAKKVVSINTVNGKTEVQTVTPEVEEVFEDLSFCFTGTPALEDITPSQEGITIYPEADLVLTNSGTSGANIVNLSSVTPLASGTKKDPISFGVDVNLTKGKLTPNVAFTDYFSAQADFEYQKFFGKDIPEDAGQWFEKTNTIIGYDNNGNLIVDNKREVWKGGYEITGNLKVSNLYVEAVCKRNFFGILESVNCELHFKVESSLSCKGTLNGSVPIFETVIPGPAGLYVKVVFSVYVDMNGEISVTATIDHTSNVTYQNKKSKAAQNTKYEVESEIGGDIASGVKGEAILAVFGIDLVDVSAKAGAGLEVNATAHKSDDAAMFCFEGKCYFPTVSISIGSNSKTAAHKLGIRATLKLVDKSGALVKSMSSTLWHREITAEGSENVKQCTWATDSAQVNGNFSSENNPPKTTPVTTPPTTTPGNQTPTTTPGNQNPTTTPGNQTPTTTPETQPPTTTPGMNGTPGACTWTLDGPVLIISGNGPMENYDYYNNNKAPWGTSFAEVIIEAGVTTIGEYAFYDCPNLASIYIPNSVTSIGDWAFADCSWLNSITIPNSVTTIGEAAFSHCESLTSINIPNSVTSIGDWAFTYCESLTSINIPNSVTSIGEAAFSYCESLTSINIPNSVTSIGEAAFSYCESLTSINIPNSVTSIGYWAFAYCLDLTSITIPNSVTSIGEYAFYICESLASINLPNSVTSIGEYAFSNCESLTSINIPNSVKSIGAYAFSYCESLTSINIPNSVTTIGDRAFAHCWDLTSITIPNSVTTIGDYAFSDCIRLASINIPNSVTTIGDRAFSGCDSLTDVYYGGSESDWKKIPLDTNSRLLAATIHYNS